MIEPGHYIIIVADGRQESSRGLTLTEFAKLLKATAVKQPTTWTAAAPRSCILKTSGYLRPADRRKEVSDIIYID